MKRSSIQLNTGPCLDCGKTRPLIAGRCRCHYWLHRNAVKQKGEPRIFKPRKPIKPVSNTQRQRIAKYSLVRAEYLAGRETCEAKIPGVCTGRATDVHHRAGRVGDLLTDKSNFMAVCRECHTWIHDNDADARERGLLLSRLKVEA